MSLYECPRCGNEAATNAKCAGPLKVSPNLLCVHGEEAVKMDLVSDADVSEEAIVDE